MIVKLKLVGNESACKKQAHTFTTPIIQMGKRIKVMNPFPLEVLLAHNTPIYSLFLRGCDLYSLSSVSKSFNQIVCNSEFEGKIWRDKCRNDFNYVASPQAEPCNRLKWKGLYLWEKQPKGWYEKYVQPETKDHRQPVIQLLDEVGCGVAIDGMGLAHMRGFRWDGSLLRLLSALNPPTEKFKETLSQLRFVFNEGRLSATEFLQDQIGSFLQFLEPGSYKIAIHSSESDLVQAKQARNPNKKSSLYDLHQVIVFTQIMDNTTINDDRVAHYIEMIESGKRPIVLAAEIRRDLFILDGHHKLLAYFELDIKPYIITISHEQHRPYMMLEERSPWSLWLQYANVDPTKNFRDGKWQLSQKEIDFFGGQVPDGMEEEFTNVYVKKAKPRQNYVLHQSPLVVEKVKYALAKETYANWIEDVTNDGAGEGKEEEGNNTGGGRTE